jgi:NCS2 family nucleobase:cation symporter-2
MSNATETTASQLTSLTYKLDDFPGVGKSALLGLQHVLIMFTAMIGLPVILSNILGLSPELRAAMINGVMIGCGIGTIVQALGVGFVGARLPIVMGVFYIFIGPIVSISNTVSIAAAMTAVMIGGLVEFALSPIIGKIQRYFPPIVTGTVITLIGVALMPIAINNAVGLNTPLFGQPLTLVLAASVIAIIVIVNRLTRGFMKAISLFIALVIGYILAAILGFIDFGVVANASWFAVPTLFPFGAPEWPGIGGLVAIVIAFFASAIETVGDAIAVSNTVEVEPTEERVRGAVAIDGLGSTIAALFGGTPLTSYSQNIGVITLTGVGSRIVVAFGGAILILFALIPKVGALISIIPAPLLGGTLVVMFGMVASIGVGILRTSLKTRRDALLFAVSVGVGLAVTVAPAGSFAVIPTGLRIIVSDGIVMGALLAIILNLVLPQEDA